MTCGLKGGLLFEECAALYDKPDDQTSIEEDPAHGHTVPAK